MEEKNTEPNVKEPKNASEEPKKKGGKGSWKKPALITTIVIFVIAGGIFVYFNYITYEKSSLVSSLSCIKYGQSRIGVGFSAPEIIVYINECKTINLSKIKEEKKDE